ncbi:hypothetical protein N0V83_000793 [Neocucurbitaria cava]|uniref:Uncharacterized protein n=1 Tax=Neocucurbitaria cava TaxID=798079 RepID=A0A9W9CSB5_9PLEO|nr:hypothetical protein N0V83_000793 [Neocucurbitaria cava]
MEELERLSSPDFTTADSPEAASLLQSSQEDDSQQSEMSCDQSSPVEERLTTKDEGDEPVTTAQSKDNQIRLESSDDDVPIMARRQLRETAKKRTDENAQRERRPVRDAGRQSGDHESNDRPRSYPVSRPTHTIAGKPRKKSGPRAWAPKPIKKNDMVAKKAVIREIESHWGKGFITSFIPKVHRPLVKRGTLGKRSHYRQHETDPKKWLPSILKAILMIAKLTTDKKWLKDAMNEVVRYRIKHTGNRKPQLVTTDFDVIEDMLVKDWPVGYSFKIRYKHLLVNRKDQEKDTDEDIDHILHSGSDQGEDSGGEVDEEDVDDDMGDHEEDDEDEDEDDDDMDQGQGGFSGRYLQSSGYTKGSPYSPPTLPRQQAKQPKPSKPGSTKAAHPRQPLPPGPQQQQNMYGYGGQMPGYPPMTDPWGRPIHFPGGGPEGYNAYGGYVPYGGHTGYGGYGPPPHQQYPIKQERQSAIPPPPHGPYQSRHAMTPALSIEDSDYRGGGRSGNNRSRRTRDGGYEQNIPMPPPMGPPGMPGYPNMGSYEQRGPRPRIKRESPPSAAGDEHGGVVEEDFDGGPENDAYTQDEADDDDDDDDSAAIDAEVEAAELELRLARLRARQAAMKKSK